MISIDVRHAFPVTVEEAFAYITNTSNWPDYWPDFLAMHVLDGPAWGEPGARVQIVIRLLNRATALNIELMEFVPDKLVKYVSQQQGLPDISHERHFSQTAGGCEFRLLVEYTPRSGFKGIFDRYLLRLSIINAINKTLYNQDRMLGFVTTQRE